MNPYRIEGPAMISFSGGRTSGFMLKQIIDAHGGRLPEDVVVAFANTGKERPETLRFVHDCETHWGVPVTWIEWRATPKRAEGNASLAAWLATHDPERRLVHADGFERVGFNSASRDGEPFEAIIALKQRLPNWKEWWCTELLKVTPLFALAASRGWKAGEYAEVIGLRADEGLRVMRSLYNAQYKKNKKGGEDIPRVPARDVRHPLSKDKVTKEMVLAFWREQPFDLGLKPYQGNCDFCFMKGRGIRKLLIRENPACATWWNRQEVERDQFFDRRDHVRDLVSEVRNFPELFDEPIDDEDYDVECGNSCAPDLMEPA